MRHEIGGQGAVAFGYRVNGRLFLFSAHHLSAHHRPEAAVHFLDGHFFRDRKHVPRISERVEKSRITFAVELVGDWALQLGTGSDRMLGERVDVGNADCHPYRRIARGLRTEASALGPLVRQHKERISNQDFGVDDTPVILEAESFSRSESILVKLDRLGHALKAQARGGNDSSGRSSFCHGCHG